MNGKRESGILCHLTSLPGEYGIGDMGPEARRFADLLADTGQSLWQILPLSPVGGSASPYQGLSAFAGNPLLISPEELRRDGLLTDEDLKHPDFGSGRIPFLEAKEWKLRILDAAADRFAAEGCSDGFRRFEGSERGWLNRYALFRAAKEQDPSPWREWKTEPRMADYRGPALRHKIIQYFFFRQCAALKAYANARGVRIVGDLPIFLDMESESLWQDRRLFLLRGDLRPAFVSGVPPDYFSATGQYWGNPMYDWTAMKEDGYKWWKERFRLLFKTVDLVRIDHFRAFSRAWHIKPNRSRSAVRGRWQEGPGAEFFDLALPKSRRGSIIAEDLGIIDDRVRALRDECGFPGMCILQFAFDGSDNLYLPHNHLKNQVVYTGTHDNNTVLGWWQDEDEETRDRVRRYLSIDGNAISRQLMTAAAMSVADTAIYPMQDLLELDGSARMNVPGQPEGCWGWRFGWEQVTDRRRDFLRDITALYHRERRS
ncbi:MAG: 4-alpha-glucanotransferase [Abditibacteriota bacterium]|nr:4-alpha-glucanotransferase [Abditibacteriota bacterium]